MFLRLLAISAVVFLFENTALQAADIDEVEQEIARLKKEISRVQSQRSDEARQLKKDRLEYKNYSDKIAERTASLLRQIDSTESELQKINNRNDSIKNLISSIASALREQELQRKRLREIILNAVRSVRSELTAYCPLIKEQYEGALNYLISEIEAGSVDHAEALYRLMRIAGDIRASAQEIQVVETASPVPDLRGTVYRLRIGAFFEAVVDAQGSKAFLWSRSTESAKEKWIAAPQEDVVSIYTAVRIREGKKIPEIVRIPLGETSSKPEEPQQ